MTLIVTVNGPETAWLLADRRLSKPHAVHREDARKVLLLDTPDGTAILGYAGLGETQAGTEPADWMSAVLRGRNLPLEQMLQVLANACKDQLPKHLFGLPGHGIFATAFVDGEPRLYGTELIFSPDRKQCWFRHTRFVYERPNLPKPKTPRFAAAGSGALHLQKDRAWMRELLRLVKASDSQKISPSAVADHLALLNGKVHAADLTVGPRCIVAWRGNPKGVHKGGGSHCSYTNGVRDPNMPMLPTISNGTDKPLRPFAG